MTEPMTDVALKNYEKTGTLHERMLCREIRRLREENERAKTEFPNSVEINRELGVRVRQLREENERLKTETERFDGYVEELEDKAEHYSKMAKASAARILVVEATIKKAGMCGSSHPCCQALRDLGDGC
jgi:predicted RNase H-like nuclease (RuvC/YqgF family)